MPAFNPLDHPICLDMPHLKQASTWVQHVPFGMCLVDLVRPALLVELGTHSGTSYCAFCQAVRTLDLSTQCVAVDTWRGDAHVGPATDDMLAALRAHHDPRYGAFSTLLQSTFDAAAAQFADGSIDVLHIDGLHTYEAVRHDFETWRPKMSQRGIMLFHDIAVTGRDFGVWRLWDDLTPHHPHFAFTHGYGLGVLAVSENYPAALAPFFTASEDDTALFRQFFQQRGRDVEARIALGRLVIQAGLALNTAHPRPGTLIEVARDVVLLYHTFLP